VRCSDCKFWRAIPQSPAGRCHRYAPRPAMHAQIMDQEGMVMETDAAWPKTLEDDFCGDFYVKREAVF
jgi:hypothetical protein